MSMAPRIALNDLADQVAAAADLDDAAHADVAFDIEVGDPDIAIYQALLATRKSLPADLLQRIRVGIDAGWWTAAMRDHALAALNKLQRGAM
jgi:hypothetical protein